MDKAELLTAFQSRVAEFERYQGFIDKARSQSTKFAPAVVEKVVKDNTTKLQKVAEEVAPIVREVDGVTKGLETDRKGILDGRQTSQFALEELELRLAIGEMTDSDFEKESRELREALGSIDSRVGAIDKELADFKAIVEKWNGVSERAGIGQPAPVAVAEEEEEEVEVEEVPSSPGGSGGATARAAVPVKESAKTEMFVRPQASSQVVEIADEDVDAFGGEDEPIGHVEKVRVTEDVSAVFDEGTEDQEQRDDGAMRAKAPVELGELDVLGDDNDLEVEAGAADDVPVSEEPRRAVLLYQEGTAEEQIHPFNGDEMTLGRGRDNDIQVKNDSKVSRYHCKLYRRGPNFYIEDNKSANGTLVNGELITERRLFGGEEVIIGETFFRFRIMD